MPLHGSQCHDCQVGEGVIMNSLFTQCYKLLISPSGDEGCRYLYKNSVELFRSHDDKNLKASLPQRNTTLSTTAPKNSTKRRLSSPPSHLPGPSLRPQRRPFPRRSLSPRARPEQSKPRQLTLSALATKRLLLGRPRVGGRSLKRKKRI